MDAGMYSSAISVLMSLASIVDLNAEVNIIFFWRTWFGANALARLHERRMANITFIFKDVRLIKLFSSRDRCWVEGGKWFSANNYYSLFGGRLFVIFTFLCLPKKAKI